MSAFLKRLNYSFGNEDWHTENKALQIKPSDRVLCITASGDRPLNLLINDCKEMVSVDMNHHQNQLLKLKAAAMYQLDFKDYLGFLENKNHPQLKKTLKSLSHLFSQDTIHYWNDHQKDLNKGILYQGSVEKWTKSISFLTKTFRKEKQMRLFAFDDIEKQKQFVQNEWDSPRWKKTFSIVLNPYITRYLFKDPGLHEFLDGSLHVGDYIYNRMNKSLEKSLARENLLISLIFLGKVLPEGYPPYLTEQGTNHIRKRLNKLQIVTGNVIEYLESVPSSSIDAFSMSDIASYMDTKSFERLTHAISRAATPNARFCIRQFLSNHKIPSSLDPIFKRNYALEKELEHEDRCFVYRFMTGSIQK
ncbi:MAG: DUF3419 family protein [Parachlamydiaceae bacterium]|nr:DUF3419 family protein [Parachlamydiaceae bacterium]